MSAEYRILAEPTAAELQTKVNRLIEDFDATLVGGPFTARAPNEGGFISNQQLWLDSKNEVDSTGASRLNNEVRPKQQVLLLQQRSDFLDAQMAIFEAGIVRELGHPFVADEVNTAFLQTDEDLIRPALKRAIEAFIKEGEWPRLDHRHYLHLQFRAFTARSAVLAVLDGGPAAEAVQKQMPNLEHRNRMIRWLFIDSWRLGGKAYLAAKTEAFLAQAASGQKGCGSDGHRRDRLSEKLTCTPYVMGGKWPCSGSAKRLQNPQKTGTKAVPGSTPMMVGRVVPLGTRVPS